MAVQQRRAASRRHAPNHRWSPLDEIETQFQAFRLISDDDADGLQAFLKHTCTDLATAELKLVSGVTGTRIILRTLDNKQEVQRRVGVLFVLAAAFFVALAGVSLCFWGFAGGICIGLAVASLLAAYPVMLLFDRSAPHTRVYRVLSTAALWLPDWLVWGCGLGTSHRGSGRNPLNTYYRSGHVVTLLHLACALEAHRVVRFLLEASPHHNLAERRDSTGARPYELPLTDSLAQIFKDWNWSRRRLLIQSYKQPDTPEVQAAREELGNLVCGLPSPLFEHILGFL